jgi:hypothetical protein
MKNRKFILGTLLLSSLCLAIMWVGLEVVLFILRLIFNL